MTELECKAYCYKRKSDVLQVIAWILSTQDMTSLKEARYPRSDFMLDPKRVCKIAWYFHRNQLDKAGKPYINHPMTVASNFNDANLQCVALLHDVLEDTSATEEELLKLGIPQCIIDDVKAVTKRDSESYSVYIERVKKNPVAVLVKLGDMMHNTDVTRNTKFGVSDCKRMDKYYKAVQQIAEMYGWLPVQ